MKLRRYEILLPLAYNDGAEIERKKFEQTNAELVTQFDATTTDTVAASGHWLYQGVIYKDQLLRYRIDSLNVRKANAFLKKVQTGFERAVSAA